MDEHDTNTLTIVPGGPRRTYLLTEDRQPVGSLHITRTAGMRGEIRTPEGTWPIARDRRHWWCVDAGDRPEPGIRLRRSDASVPGEPVAIAWNIAGRIGHLRGTLGADDRAVVVKCSGWRAPHATAEINGTWQHQHAVVLACFFGLLCRRQRAITLLST